MKSNHPTSPPIHTNGEKEHHQQTIVNDHQHHSPFNQLQQQHATTKMTTKTVNEIDNDPVSTMVAFSAFEPSSPNQHHDNHHYNEHHQHQPAPPLSWRHYTAKSMQILDSCPRDSQQPLTVFAKLSIHPGYERDFEQWYHDITKLQHDHWPGYLSSELVRPIANSNEYISIFRYDNYEHLEAWMTSSQRHSMLVRAKEFSHAPPQLSFHSLEYWFVPPQDLKEDDEATVDGQPSSSEQLQTQASSTATQQHHAHVRPPAKYKMVVITFLVIWATNQWTSKVVLRIFGKGTLPKTASQALATFLTVLVAAYFALPISTALLGFWLFPHQPYTTSLHNGFMSLPWPIPPLVTWLESKCTSSTTAEGSYDDKDRDDATSNDKKEMDPRKSSVATAKTELDHDLRPGSMGSQNLEVLEDLA